MLQENIVFDNRDDDIIQECNLIQEPYINNILENDEDSNVDDIIDVIENTNNIQEIIEVNDDPFEEYMEIAVENNPE